MADVNLQYNNGAPVREKVDFGELPIMLMVRDHVHLVFLLYSIS